MTEVTGVAGCRTHLLSIHCGRPLVGTHEIQLPVRDLRQRFCRLSFLSVTGPRQPEECLAQVRDAHGDAGERPLRTAFTPGPPVLALVLQPYLQACKQGV